MPHQLGYLLSILINQIRIAHTTKTTIQQSTLMTMSKYSVHSHLMERNWAGLEVDLCLTASQAALKEFCHGGLPLHIAIQLNAPDNIILDMIRIYPAAVTRKDRNGDLPLHTCAKYGSSEAVVTALLLEYPDAIQQRTVCRLKGRVLTARDLAQHNPKVSRSVREIFDKPMSYWVVLARHERVMREKTFETTLRKMQQLLQQSQENEERLMKRLDTLERRLDSAQKDSRSTFVRLEKKVVNRIEQQQECLVSVQDDLVALSATRRDDSQYRNNGTIGRRRQSIGSVVCNDVKREESYLNNCDTSNKYFTKPRRRSVGDLKVLDKDRLPSTEQRSKKANNGLMSKVRRSSFGRVVGRHAGKAAHSTASSTVGISFLFPLN